MGQFSVYDFFEVTLIDSEELSIFSVNPSWLHTIEFFDPIWPWVFLRLPLSFLKTHKKKAWYKYKMLTGFFPNLSKSFKSNFKIYKAHLVILRCFLPSMSNVSGNFDQPNTAVSLLQVQVFLRCLLFFFVLFVWTWSWRAGTPILGCRRRPGRGHREGEVGGAPEFFGTSFSGLQNEYFESTILWIKGFN